MNDLRATLDNLKIQKQHVENELLMIKDKIKITTKQLQDTCPHDTLALTPHYDGHKHYSYYICQSCFLETNMPNNTSI